LVRDVLADPGLLARPLDPVIRGDSKDTKGYFASTLMAEYFGDRPDVAIDLLLAADPSHYAGIVSKLKGRQPEDLVRISAGLSLKLNTPTADCRGMTKRDLDQCLGRSGWSRAKAGIALAMLGSYQSEVYYKAE
jgi:hypothetical protein